MTVIEIKHPAVLIEEILGIMVPPNAPSEVRDSVRMVVETVVGLTLGYAFQLWEGVPPLGAEEVRVMVMQAHLDQMEKTSRDRIAKGGNLIVSGPVLPS